MTALDGSLAISSNKFTVAGNTGNTLWWRGRWTPGDYVEQPELGSCDAVEHAGCDGSDDAVEHVERDGSCGDAVESTLDVAGDVDVNSGKFAVTALDGSLAISSNKFTVAGNTGNTVVAGTLDAGGLR